MQAIHTVEAMQTEVSKEMCQGIKYEQFKWMVVIEHEQVNVVNEIK